MFRAPVFAVHGPTQSCSTGWLKGLVVSALGIPARGPGFESRVVPLFYWVATLGKLYTHIASPVSQLQETGEFLAAVVMVIA